MPELEAMATAAISRFEAFEEIRDSAELARREILAELADETARHGRLHAEGEEAAFEPRGRRRGAGRSQKNDEQ